MQAFWLVVYVLLSIFWFFLIVRLIVEVVKSFAREWFPSGIVAILLEGVFTVTDPPIKALRKVLPSPTLGPIRVDLSFIVLFLLVVVAQSIVGSLMR
ncbi:YggT family protein [Tsukamurella sp. PLM1]|uniref:YggT family protein n=1 Tax=Tsukamurella sp. PLM1 TaxID=2929795 RepID=UPI002051F322|nr:YggT family protein [Tsukamurella sp. PLM1]BDH58044.1 YggT family protein [Tsukamurella sp. PLM1]